MTLLRPTCAIVVCVLLGLGRGTPAHAADGNDPRNSAAEKDPVSARAPAPDPVSSAPLGPTSYFAPRTDGRPGSGTADDPYDASTALKFDRLMEDHARANCTVILAEGTYLTWGADGEESPLAGRNVLPDKRRGFMLPAGVTLKGAGMGRTIIKLTDVDVTGGRTKGMNQHRVLCSGINGQPWSVADQDNITIENLTVDCNSRAIIPAHRSLEAGDPQHIEPWDVAIDAITLGGSNCRVRNVEVKGVYGYAAPNEGPRREAWAIGLGAIYYGNCDRNLIEGCVVRDFEGNYVSGVGIGGSGDRSLGSGIVRDCMVIGNPYAAYIAGNSDGVIFRNNVAVNCGSGFRSDTGTLMNIEFRENVFICSVWPLEVRLQSQFNTDQSVRPKYGHFTITGNLFFGADQMIFVGASGIGPALGAPQGFSGMDLFNNTMFSTSARAFFLTIDDNGSRRSIAANCHDFRARDNLALSPGNFGAGGGSPFRVWNGKKEMPAPVTQLPSKGKIPLVTPEGGVSAAPQGIVHDTPFTLAFSTSALKPLKTYVLEGIGLPDGVHVSPPLPRTFSGASPPSVKLSWTPAASQVGDHVIVLRIRQDDTSGLLSYGFRRVSVR